MGDRYAAKCAKGWEPSTVSSGSVWGVGGSRTFYTKLCHLVSVTSAQSHFTTKCSNSHKQFYDFIQLCINNTCIFVLCCVSNNNLFMFSVQWKQWTAIFLAFSVQLVLDPYLPQRRQISAPCYWSLGRPLVPAHEELNKNALPGLQQTPKRRSILCSFVLLTGDFMTRADSSCKRLFLVRKSRDSQLVWRQDPSPQNDKLWHK